MNQMLIDVITAGAGIYLIWIIVIAIVISGGLGIRKK